MNIRSGVKLIGLLLVTILALFGCSSEEPNSSVNANATEENKDWPDKIRFAVTDVEGMEELRRTFGPFKEKLQELIGIEIEYFAVTDRTVGTTALEYDQVDLLLAGPAEYVQLKSVMPEVEPIIAIERENYYSSVIVHEESEYQTLEDLKGKKVAMSDAGSTSGHIGPSIIFMEAGFDLDKDLEIMLLGDLRIDAFKNGEVDALATRMTDYLQMVEEDGEGKYRVLVEGPPLPSDPFVANPKLPKDLVELIRNTMLENQEEIIDSIVSSGGENDKFEGAKLIQSKDEDYNSMRDAYGALGLELE